MLTGTTGCPSEETSAHDEQAVERSTRQVNILLIGGSRLLQESVVHLLDDSKFSVERCVTSIDHAIQAIRERPDLYDLLIVQLFGNSEVGFFENLALLKSIAGDRRVALLAWPMKDRSFLNSSFESGIDAYLESSLSQEGLRQSLDNVIAGNRVFPSRLQPPSRWEPDEGQVADPEPGAALSRREVEILRHLANGEPNKIIAKALDITEATVKVHVKGILRKTGARNRTSAAIWAIQNGLTPAVQKPGD